MSGCQPVTEISIKKHIRVLDFNTLSFVSLELFSDRSSGNCPANLDQTSYDERSRRFSESDRFPPTGTFPSHSLASVSSTQEAGPDDIFKSSGKCPEQLLWTFEPVIHTLCVVNLMNTKKGGKA